MRKTRRKILEGKIVRFGKGNSRDQIPLIPGTDTDTKPTKDWDAEIRRLKELAKTGHNT